MYNYIGTLRKSTSINHCVKSFITSDQIPNLILSKNNTIEIYDLSKDGLLFNKELQIYGKINLLIDISSNHKKTNNLFILTENLSFSTIFFNSNTRKFDTDFSGSLNEELGQRQEIILYSLDINKNYLLISIFKNIFKLICFNNNKIYTIKYQYDNLLFLSPFNINNDNINKSLLSFAMVKVSNKNNSSFDEINTDNSKNNSTKEMSLETFQIKINEKSFNAYFYENKKNYVSNKNKNISLNITSKKKAASNTHEELLENFNLLQKIDISINPTVSLMITHPNGIIILFFLNYVLYYKYDLTTKKFLCENQKKINYTNRRFINYTKIDEKKYKYFVTDEYGNLFLLAFAKIYNSSEMQFILQFLGTINYSSCLCYIDNNYLFNGSNKSNSQLIKIEPKNNSYVNIIENFESLSPIKELTLINNMEEENGIEILTISGIDKQCCLKKITKGNPVLMKGYIDVKNIKNCFKINLEQNIYSFIITTIMNSFIIDYNKKNNEINLNKNTVLFDKNEIILFAFDNLDNIIIVSNLCMKVYNKTAKKNLIEYKFENDIKPLIIKYSKTMNTIYIYFNNRKLISYEIDFNNYNLKNINEIFNNISICSFDVSKLFIIYSLWDENDINIYSINSKNNNILKIADESMQFLQISSIQIFKNNKYYCIFISLSNGKLYFYCLKEESTNYKKNYIFKESDFIFKRKYNLYSENFTIKKMKSGSKNYLFINTPTPYFIFLNAEIPEILSFNIKNCKNLIELEENSFLFLLKNKIAFGALSNVHSYSISTRNYGKQINTMKLISFDDKNIKKDANYIVYIEENKIENIIRNTFILTDINLKEISRYEFANDNEICNTFTEINTNDEYKLFILGTEINLNISKEPIYGNLTLLEIDFNNNYKIKKLTNIETVGGVYKVISQNNIIYASCGNTLYIYTLNKKINDNNYEITLSKKYSDFNLINNICLFNEDFDNNEIIEDNNNNENNKLNNISKKTFQYLLISDIYKSVFLYSYEIEKNKLTEICRDYNSTWVYSMSQISNDMIYITDIDSNIITLKRNLDSNNEQEKIKCERVAYFNYGERINTMTSTKIKNKDLVLLSDNSNKFKDEVNIIYFGTVEGSIGVIIQINKEIYNFLKKLEEFLVSKKGDKVGDFDFKRLHNYRNGFIEKEDKGFIEGEIVESFLNNDEMYKKQILEELKYPWDKNYREMIWILETLAKCH